MFTNLKDLFVTKIT